MTALCRSRGRFGRCGLEAGHGGNMHAVEIGGDVWFGYRSGRGQSARRVGYGRFEPDGFRLLDSAAPGGPPDPR